MSILLDTNLLARLAQPSHSMYAAAANAVDELLKLDVILYITPQNFYEFWVVATRPEAQNGLGFTPAQAQAELARLKAIFILLDDTPAVLPQWERLVTQHQVIGKNAHDAHLVAAMLVHGINQILTFNVSDFRRYQNIVVLDPRQIVASQPPSP